MSDAHSAWSILWTAPLVLLASLMIAWGAESAQFFMAQGFALVILAWMQTLPEFAVEAVLAWHGHADLLIANLTGAIRLLIGLGWPLIYATAAFSYRRKYDKPMREIKLEADNSATLVGVLVCLAYVSVIVWKGSLGLWDAGFLLLIYAAYLLFLRNLPAEGHEDIAHLEGIPRAIVTARRPVRNIAIAALFLGGGALIFLVADPFVASMMVISSTLGISQFIFIQWVAPFVSEFPEGVSAFYWAREIVDAPMALMNMVSSNITQWALLAALLPVVLSIGVGHPAAIVFDSQQKVELLMTLGQSLMGMLFLINMRLAWWEAAAIFVLWAVQFGFSLVGPAASQVHLWTTFAYFAWAAVEVVLILVGRRKPEAFHCFHAVWNQHVRPDYRSMIEKFRK
jgi:cation:H+ antiporter